MPDDAKRRELARRGVLHPHPERVIDALFQDDPFFDARDALQVKYEMLRAVRVQGRPASEAARDFGLSRPTYYQAKAAFEQGGLQGLLPAKKGPRRAHKLSESVMSFVAEQLWTEPSLDVVTLAERVHAAFGLRVHPRSMRRALARRSKKNG
jgi:transposase